MLTKGTIYPPIPHTAVIILVFSYPLEFDNLGPSWEAPLQLQRQILLMFDRGWRWPGLEEDGLSIIFPLGLPFFLSFPAFSFGLSVVLSPSAKFFNGCAYLSSPAVPSKAEV